MLTTILITAFLGQTGPYVPAGKDATVGEERRLAFGDFKDIPVTDDHENFLAMMKNGGKTKADMIVLPAGTLVRVVQMPTQYSWAPLNAPEYSWRLVRVLEGEKKDRTFYVEKLCLREWRRTGQIYRAKKKTSKETKSLSQEILGGAAKKKTAAPKSFMIEIK